MSGPRLGRALLAVLCALLLPRANAFAEVIALEGNILFPGDSDPTPWTGQLLVDGDQPDEDPTLGIFQATNHGTAEVHVDALGGLDLAGGLGEILAVTDFPDSTWEASLDFQIGQAVIPTVIQLVGTSPVPDQSLPYFFTFNGGTITVDGSALGIGIGTGSITYLAVPEPGTALLLGLGLAGLAMRQRRRTSAP